MQLYAKILLKKGDYDKVLAFLNQHKASFGMIIENQKLAFKVHLKRGDTLSAINELLGIVGTNYTNVGGDFQSIYDHHELLISLLAEECKKAGVSITEELILTQLNNPTSLPDFASLQTLTKESLMEHVINLYASFGKYVSFDLDNRTSNYHNCRKSALLSQLLIKNKLLLIVGSSELISSLVSKNTDQAYKS